MGDVAFRGLARTVAGAVLALMATIGLFLLLRSLPALRHAGLSFLTAPEWTPPYRFGVLAVLAGTILVAAIALVTAVPVGLGAALYISEYAPSALRRPLVSVVDLMAAIPSIVYALWGFFFLQSRAIGLSRWLSVHAGFFPPFRVDAATDNDLTSSMFIAGLVVGLTVVPIVCALSREVFAQAPTGEREAALALGGTRWGMIRTVVLPYGRAGMVGATMLGLGRALGETVTVYYILSPIFHLTDRILASGGNTISALIANRYSESDAFGISALMAAGLVLFALTLAVNMAASAIVSRARSGAATEL